MRFHRLLTTLACAGAAAYTISKVHLAVRGEIGMPGFPAPPESYEQIADPTGAQLGNAGLGVVLLLLTAALLRPPAHTVTRRLLLGANWLGILMVGAGVAGFTLRAAAVVPALGEPAEGPGAWVALAVGAVWTVSWVPAVLGARGRRTPRRSTEAPTGTAAR